jgi:hypothetical protein
MKRMSDVKVLAHLSLAGLHIVSGEFENSFKNKSKFNIERWYCCLLMSGL